jgi:hypothetical protein
MMQGRQPIEVGRIGERLRNILKVFPRVGTGQIHDPVAGIDKVAWIVTGLSQRAAGLQRRRIIPRPEIRLAR